MTLRTKIVLWFILLHLVFAGLAAFLIMQNRMLLFAVEAFFVVSILISYRLVRALFVPLELIRTGTELMNERDFSSRFVPVGQPEMDRLIEIYNRMIDHLHDERLAAEEQHQLLQKIVDASPAGIVICDFEGKVEQTNPAAAPLLREMELPSIGPGEARLITLAGARRVKVSRREFRDRGFVKSVYLLEELTEELRLSEKAAYEKLIRVMSHEVNNSVGAVRSLLDSMIRYAEQVGVEDREDFRNALTVASTRIDSLNRFMSGFAEVARIPLPHPGEVRMSELVETTAALLRPEIEQRDISLRLDLASDGIVRADQHQLEQVIINVLRNSIEAVGRSGAIDVVWREGVLSVCDTGHGIDEHSRNQLFTPFFTTKREGRGLGLTVVQEILANHHLPFTLRNRPEGGAEFRIDFSRA